MRALSKKFTFSKFLVFISIFFAFSEFVHAVGEERRLKACGFKLVSKADIQNGECNICMADEDGPFINLCSSCINIGACFTCWHRIFTTATSHVNPRKKRCPFCRCDFKVDLDPWDRAFVALPAEEKEFITIVRAFFGFDILNQALQAMERGMIKKPTALTEICMPDSRVPSRPPVPPNPAPQQKGFMGLLANPKILIGGGVILGGILLYYLYKKGYFGRREQQEDEAGDIDGEEGFFDEESLFEKSDLDELDDFLDDHDEDDVDLEDFDEDDECLRGL